MASLRKKVGTGEKAIASSPLSIEKETVKAWVKYIIYPKTKYKTETTQFFVLSCQDPFTKSKITCAGNLLSCQVGDYLEFTGNWEKGKDGKETFRFDYAQRVESDEYGCASLMSYLFGPANAKKIIASYEDDPIVAFETFKYSLPIFKVDMIPVKGIGPKIIEKAEVKYEKSLKIESLYNKFFKYNLSINQIIKIINHWGSRTDEKMNENVYNLLYLDGFKFEVVDTIAQKFYHIDKTDKRRIKAVLTQILINNSSMTGDCFMYLEGENGLISKAQEKLDISSQVIIENMIELSKSRVLYTEIVGYDTIVMLYDINEAEKQLAQVVASLVRNNIIVKRTKIDDYIEEYESSKGFKLADKQREAIKTSAINQFSIISGPPGSGKTTIVDAICTIFKKSKKNCRIKLCAPTGRAAKRMMESTGMEASTIHRLLGYSPQGWKYDENNPLPDVDVLIVDEFSMTDLRLAHRLLMAIGMNTVVIIVGDQNQLPSVDAGQVLEDLLKVLYIPKTILNKIYRQKAGSTVLQRALDFNDEKEVDLSDSSDFHFIEEDDLEAVKEKTIQLYLEEVEKYGIDNVSLLVPQNVGPIGTVEFNTILQDVLNPFKTKEEEIRIGKRRKYRLNDRVIQLKNMAEFDIYNGMIGTIKEIIYNESSPAESSMIVDFGDDITHEYTRTEFDLLQLAYATTIHKSQGAEFLSAIMVMDERQKFMNRKKLVYTGWTRIKNELHIVGQKKMVQHAILNKDKERKTRLVSKFMDFEPGI